MECRKISGLLSQYVDDALDSRSRKAVEEHVAVCDQCAAELADLEGYLETMGSLRRFNAPSDFLESVRHRVEHHIENRSRFGKLSDLVLSFMHAGSPIRWAGAVAALLVLLITYHGLDINKEMGKETGYAPLMSPLTEPAESPRAPAETQRALTGPPRTEAPSAEIEAPSAESKAPPGIHPATPAPSPKPIELVLVLGRQQPVTEADAPTGAGVQSPKGATAPKGEERARLKGLAPRSDASRPAAAPAPSLRDEGRASESSKQGLGETEAGRALTQEGVEKGFGKEESSETKLGAESRQPTDTGDKSQSPLPSREALAQIQNSIRNIGGTILAVQYNAEESFPRSLTASVPVENLSALLRELAQIGSVDQPAELPLSTGESHTVEIKVSLEFSR